MAKAQRPGLSVSKQHLSHGEARTPAGVLDYQFKLTLSSCANIVLFCFSNCLMVYLILLVGSHFTARD